jgi:hypothetical protein
MASNELPIPRDPTDDEALALFRAIEEKFPSKTLGDDKWYILAVSNLYGLKLQTLTTCSMQPWLVAANLDSRHCSTKSS